MSVENFVSRSTAGGINLAPESIVLTTKRFIRYKPKLLGGADFQDHIWRDLKDAKMQETLTGATLSLATTHGTRVSVDYLPKAQARKLYSFAQEMEEHRHVLGRTSRAVPSAWGVRERWESAETDHR